MNAGRSGEEIMKEKGENVEAGNEVKFIIISLSVYRFSVWSES